MFGIARREDRLRDVVENYAIADLRDPGEAAAAVEAGARALGGIDVLVNAAGVIGFGGTLDTSLEEWDRLFASNVDSLFHVTRAAIPHLIERRGAVLNVSSVCSYRPFPNVTAYCMTKAAVDMFTKCLALELASNGVRVNAVSPGVVVTELFTATDATQDLQAVVDYAATTHPLGRAGQPEDIAAYAAFLCSDEAGWITGGIHAIDGGRNLTSS